MPGIIDLVTARVAFLHVRGLYSRFQAAIAQPERAQERVLHEVLRERRDTDFGRHFGLRGIRTARDFRRAMPVLTYEDHRPFIARVMSGETGALFPPSTPIYMFATSSGTTASPKYVPVTRRFVREYRRGWNTFGAKLMLDYPAAMLRPILQVSGRMDESRAPGGLPCGAITGLLARTQKRIVRRYYVGPPLVASLDDPRSRHYALMRFGIARDVAFVMTASPATLIQLARLANDECESLVRDVRDGTLSPTIVTDERIRAELARGLRPDPRRAAELERLRRGKTRFVPADYWRLAFVGCWTGGTMGMYLGTLREWYGEVPVREIGLLASEGRVTIPLETGSGSGVLDVLGAFFEFIPAQCADSRDPPILTACELEVGSEYAVVLTNFSGLTRYRLDDVVRVDGVLGRTPTLRFLRRAGRVVSLAGEKLTESQIVTAVRRAADGVAAPEVPYVVVPRWGDPPFYAIVVQATAPPTWLARVDDELCAANSEYASRRKSNRLGRLELRAAGPEAFTEFDRRLLSRRGSRPEQYKRPCLIVADDEAREIEALVKF